MAQRLPDRVRDLVEIATLVYAADQSCKRVSGVSIDFGDTWYRTMRFEIAVRDLAFWSQRKVTDCLTDMLAFLTDDNYEFVFHKMSNPPAFEEYLDFKSNMPDPVPVERVILFSGGLDSLAGAVDEILVHKHRVALVSHKPVDHLAKKQRELVAEIAKRAGDSKLNPLHFPVLANRISATEGDYTQRSRSFLYASFALAVADYFTLNEIVFFENGIVSVNLPLCAQEIGGRSTRTTHPKCLHDFAQLFSLVVERDFAVQTPFLWDTKEDVLHRLRKAGHVDLARSTLSCSHTRQFTSKSPHCGKCSQCLSRRVAAIGADYGEHDPEAGYRTDVLTGTRGKDHERILAERFVGTARQVEAINDVGAFHQKFAGELGRVYGYLGMNAQLGAEKMFDLHHRHSVQVGKVMLAAMKSLAEDRRTGVLPDTCVANYAFDAGKASAVADNAHSDADDKQLAEEINRLKGMERDAIQALCERRIDVNASGKPNQATLAKWAGHKYDATFKAALASLYKAGFLDNGRHHGTRGGYYFTPKGERAGRWIISNQS